MSELSELERRIFEKIDSSVEKVTDKLETFRGETTSSITEIKTALGTYTSKTESLEAHTTAHKGDNKELEGRLRMVEDWKSKNEGADKIKDKHQDFNWSVQAKVFGTLASALIMSLTTTLLTLWASGALSNAIASP